MEKERLLIVGLEKNEVNFIRNNTNCLLLSHDIVPKAKLVEGVLWVESATHANKYLKIDKVIYHGIYENDFDFITLLALWRGDCLPNAEAMMDLRLRHSGLVRSLKASRFKHLKRGMSIKPETWHTENRQVAKWGNWHCGENKHLFDGTWEVEEVTVFEPFIEGKAVRIMLIGEQAWQINLTGDDWKKSIHHQDSGEMEIDEELVMDAKNISKHFNLEITGIDYMIDNNGNKYLLEVNHIPNVTVFPFVNEAFLDYAINWIKKINTYKDGK